MGKRRPTRALSSVALRLQPDSRLVELARAGSRPALETLLERYRGQLQSYCSRLLDAHRAEDVVQEALTKAVLAVERDDRPLHFRAWVFRVTHNLAINALKKPTNTYQQLDEQHEQVGAGVDQTLQRSEDLGELMSSLRLLSEGQRAALILQELEGLSAEEIAERLDSTPHGVHQLVSRARARLRDSLGLLLPLPLLLRLARSQSYGVFEAGSGFAMSRAAKAAVVVVATATIATGGTGLLNNERIGDSSRNSDDSAQADGSPLAHVPSVHAPPRDPGQRRRRQGPDTGPQGNRHGTLNPRPQHDGGHPRPESPAGTTPQPQRGATQAALPANSTGDAPPQQIWQPAVVLSGVGVDAQHPRLAGNAGGAAAAVWQSGGPATSRIHAVVRPAGGEFSQEQTLSSPGDSATDARVAVDRLGNTVVVWRVAGTGELEASFAPAGQAFQAPEVITAPGTQALQPEVVFDSDGAAIVAWYTNGAASHVETATREPGHGFSTPQPLAGAGSNPSRPQLVAGPSGTVLATWDSTADPVREPRRVQVSVKSSGADFSAAQTISAPGKNAIAPSPAIDPHGNTVVVWSQSAAPRDREFHIEAAYGHAGETLGRPGAISPAGTLTSQPSVAIDTRGMATIIWRSLDGDRWSVSSTVRKDGRMISAPATISDPGGYANDPRLAVEASGRAIVVWSRYQIDLAPDTYEVSIGASQKPSDGSFSEPRDISSKSMAWTPQIVADARGDALAVWQRFDGANWRIECAALTQTH